MNPGQTFPPTDSPAASLMDTRRKEAVLATPAELRDRLRQTGKAVAARDARLETVRALVQQNRHLAGPLLPILHAVQDALGCIPPEGVTEIAEGLNLSRAEVHGVISYYHHFRSEPAGAHQVALCRAEACRAMGSEALWAQACQHWGLDEQGGHSADGQASLEAVYCLGLCAQSPSAMVDGQLHARLTPERLQRLLNKLPAAAPHTHNNMHNTTHSEVAA